MSIIKKIYNYDLLDQAVLKALDDKGLLPKKPKIIGYAPVVDRGVTPSIASQRKSKATNRKKINTIVNRKEETDE